MVEVPTTITQDDLTAWYKAKDELAKAKALEGMLRNRIFKGLFPTPVEGAQNKFTIPGGDGYIVQGTHNVNRKVIEAAVDEYKVKMKEPGSNLPKFNFAKLIRYKPELAKSEYNKLTAEERAVFDGVLEIKDGSPELEIKKPARG